MALSPLDDFLKYSRESRVRAHNRKVRGKTVSVSAHSRTSEEEAPEPKSKEEQLRARQARELAMWKKWKDGGQQLRDLEPLLHSFQPMIRARINQYAGKIRIPNSAIDTNFQLEFVNALHSYDPTKGALGTYVFQYLNKGKRWIAENQNIGRIPENRIYKIRQYETVVNDLTEDLGREPNHKEISERIGWAKSEVERMDAELTKDLISQGFEEDPFAVTPSRTEEILKLFKYELDGDQRTVYEYLTGYGKPHISAPGEIAEKMNMKGYQVSRIKRQLETKIRRYLEG